MSKKIKNKISSIITKANDKWGSPKGTFIVLGITLASLILISLCIYFAIDSYNNEMERQYQLRLQQEEEERIAAEQQAKLEAELLPIRQYECVYNLPRLNLDNKYLNLNITYQYPEYPSGCEVIAMTNMLNYYNFGLYKSTLVNNYLPYSWSDWVNYYSGDPSSEDPGGCIMSPGIKDMTDAFLKDNPSKFKAFNVSGKNFEDLFTYIERGHPVQIWSTIDMSEPYNILSQIGDYKWYENNHSVLITGFDKSTGMVTVVDSINGEESYRIKTVNDIYEKQNYQAIVIVSEDELNSWLDGNLDASYM